MMRNNIQEYSSFDLSIFEVVDNKVNLTKIADHFGKRVDVWLKTKSTQRFLDAYKAIPPFSGIETIKGGNGGQGTFGDRRIALKFAEWISVDFEIWANEQIDTLLQTGKVELQPQKELSMMDVLKLNMSMIEKLSKELQDTKLSLDHKQAVVLELIESVPAITMRLTINRVVRNWASNNGYQFHFAWTKLYSEFRDTYHTDLRTRSKNLKISAIQYAENIGQLEELYLLSLKMFETE